MKNSFDLKDLTSLMNRLQHLVADKVIGKNEEEGTPKLVDLDTGEVLEEVKSGPRSKRSDIPDLKNSTFSLTTVVQKIIDNDGIYNIDGPKGVSDPDLEIDQLAEVGRMIFGQDGRFNA